MVKGIIKYFVTFILIPLLITAFTFQFGPGIAISYGVSGFILIFMGYLIYKCFDEENKRHIIYYLRKWLKIPLLNDHIPWSEIIKELAINDTNAWQKARNYLEEEPEFAPYVLKDIHTIRNDNHPNLNSRDEYLQLRVFAMRAIYVNPEMFFSLVQTLPDLLDNPHKDVKSSALTELGSLSVFADRS